MTDLTPTLTGDLLLAHERFVHSIARDLLRDEHAAADVVQDTWLVALRRGPRAPGALRSWLGRIAANRAIDVRRVNERRQRREVEAFAGASSESVGDTAARLALQRDVVGAVLDLGEPYRSVVLLRYYHDLEPTEIAARLGSKPATVRTQLVRAHEQLRERLDRDHGGRAAWAALLLPAPAKLAPPASFGMKVAVLGTVVAIAATGYFASRVDDPQPPASQVSVAAASVEPADVPVAVRVPVRRWPIPAAIVPSRDAPQAKAIPEVVGPRAVLREGTGAAWADAGFSFVHAYGGRERLGKDKARGDYDVVFTRGSLRADSVTDDRSMIVDLGLLPLTELARVPLEAHRSAVRDAAQRRYGRRVDPQATQVRAELGHVYFVWTQDTDSDHAALFTVAELDKQGCTLEWYWTEDGSWARCSVQSPAGARTLAAAAIELREAARSGFELENGDRTMKHPRIVVQARAGAVGGNACRLDLARQPSVHFDRMSRGPIDVATPIGISEQAVGYCNGGLIPDGRMLVITSVTWAGEARGDSNGGGCFHVQLGDLELVKVKNSDVPIRGAWTGRVELVRGQEDRAFLEIANSSQGEVTFSGAFEKLAK
ncbi:MAG TPA: sigma-70 family RNA polymerase sigma factor [Planctomycetota bacterium]